MILKIILTLLLAALAGILYRLGGAAKTDNWYRFLQNTKSRDFGVPLIELIIVWLWAGFYPSYWWAYVLSFGAAFGFMTTYWKKKGSNAKWYNWALTGAGYSLGFLPYALATHDWIGFALRFIILTVFFTVWKTKQGNAVWSEVGAGVLTSLSAVLLVVGFKKPDSKK